MKDIVVAITAASYSGNKGAAAMIQSSIKQLYEKYGHRLNIHLMSVYPEEDKKQIPFDFIQVVSCKPEQLLFAFPLAVLYHLFKWCKPAGKLLRYNSIINAYCQTDVVLDEAGISFVDSRGFVMNLYAWLCAAVPLLIGVPVVKYSQAMGPFHRFSNRFLAKWILPRLSLICARGEITYNNLKGLGVTRNVVLCADGAFSMEDDEIINDAVENLAAKDSFFDDKVVGLSVSSVVLKKCNELKIDYEDVMVNFIDFLNEQGYKVLIIANAARINSHKPRNNDLMICDKVYQRVDNKELVRWYHKEMTAEEIRAYISQCKYLIASRFHAMIGALQKRVPVLLIGWSHKYKEVLDMFELGQYAIDFSLLNIEELQKTFLQFVQNDRDICEKINRNHESVINSSRENIKFIGEVIDQNIGKPLARSGLLDIDHPEKYIGNYLCQRKGYAKEDAIRKNASSGGVVTALLCYLLKHHYIDGAWVTRNKIVDGELGYESYIATTKEEIMNASSSVYMDMPLLQKLDIVRNFQGKIAVVLTPCLMSALSALMETHDDIKDKIVFKIGLYCCGVTGKEATLLPLQKLGITLENAKRIYYKRGHWRGISSVIYEDNSQKDFSYTKTICAYRNAYFFQKRSCMFCQDQYAMNADISFGDIWLKKMKKLPYKYTSCIIRSEKAYEWYFNAVMDGCLADSHISSGDLLYSQKRALVFKYNCAPYKSAELKKNGKTVRINTDSKCKWNHRLAYKLAEKNRKFSVESYGTLEKIPMGIIYYYMCFIRVLLSF